MPNNFFSFKQFTVHHELCAMKVGTDGVLLGAWAEINHANTILDVGTGTALIALMIAQRTEALITAIDIDSNAILQASQNIQLSPWTDRIQLFEKSLQQFSENPCQQFDLIVSNPPYFENALLSPSYQRTLARHTDSLTHHEFIDHSISLLKPNGKICMILPLKEGLQTIEYGLKRALFCNKKTSVYPKPNSGCKRLLLEFSFIETSTVENEITIETENRHQYSEEFKALVKDFYLKL